MIYIYELRHDDTRRVAPAPFLATTPTPRRKEPEMADRTIRRYYYKIGETQDTTVYVTVVYRQVTAGTELSITYAEMSHRKSLGMVAFGNGMGFEIVKYAPGWDEDKHKRLVQIARAWHLNGLRAGCQHQRAEGWAERPIDPSKPTNTYGFHFEGQKLQSWNMLVWVTPDEHPDGLLTVPCETCGYEYGTTWLYEEVPADVFAWLEAQQTVDSHPIDGPSIMPPMREET